MSSRIILSTCLVFPDQVSRMFTVGRPYQPLRLFVEIHWRRQHHGMVPCMPLLTITAPIAGADGTSRHFLR